MDFSTDQGERELELQLRALELQQISAKALLEISRKLDLIRERLAASDSPARHLGDWWLNGWRRS